MRLMETRLDDHLTDAEVKERLEWLDRVAVSCADPLGAEGAEAVIRNGYIRSVLGVLGIVVAVCGIGALLFGLFGS